MGIIFGPDSAPETDLSACSHRQINPNNSNFHESETLKLLPFADKKAVMASYKALRIYPVVTEDV